MLGFWLNVLINLFYSVVFYFRGNYGKVSSRKFRANSFVFVRRFPRINGCLVFLISGVRIMTNLAVIKPRLTLFCWFEFYAWIDLLTVFVAIMAPKGF